MWGDIAIAFLLAFITAFVITPYTIRLARRVGAVDIPNDRRVNKTAMPRLGGLAVIAGFVMSAIYLVITMKVENKIDFISEELDKKILGVFLILLVIWLYFFSDRVRIKPTVLSAGLAGIVSGTCGGLFSVNGPPMVLYFVSVIEDKRTYMATIQCYFMINNMYLLAIRYFSNLIPSGIAVSVLWGLAGLILGSFLGGRVFNSMDTKKLKGFIYIFMAMSGAWIAITG